MIYTAANDPGLRVIAQARANRTINEERRHCGSHGEAVRRAIERVEREEAGNEEMRALLVRQVRHLDELTSWRYAW